MSNKYQSPTGMRDLFEEDLDCFEKIEKTAKNLAEFYNFKKIQTPILEQTELFERSSGETSDIVEKQMYSLKTRGGELLTLRPELTPGVVRAYIQHGMHVLPKPVKLWYSGPAFRHERPQAGRLRQFHNVGFECFGVQDAVVDAELIQIAYSILKDLGLKNLIIQVNSIGDSQCRTYYRKSLVSYFRSRQAGLCGDCKRRLKTNPLRILDCKDEKCQRIKQGAPQILDHLCKQCHDHFKSLLEFLEEQGLPYILNSYLVRGLDYYTKTVFEIAEDTEDGIVMGTLAGGGRYDDLTKVLGGKETPACGFAIGVERVANLLKAKNKKGAIAEKTADIFLAQVGELAKRRSVKLIEAFRAAKIKVAESLYRDSLSAQLKAADKMNAKYVLILGQKEALDDDVIIREMDSGKQRTIPMARVVGEMKRKIKSR